jgi:hypothetical protein
LQYRWSFDVNYASHPHLMIRTFRMCESGRAEGKRGHCLRQGRITGVTEAGARTHPVRAFKRTRVYGREKRKEGKDSQLRARSLQCRNPFPCTTTMLITYYYLLWSMGAILYPQRGKKRGAEEGAPSTKKRSHTHAQRRTKDTHPPVWASTERSNNNREQTNKK